MRAAAAEAIAQQRSEASAAEEEARMKLEAQGVTIRDLDEDAHAPFRTAAAPVVDVFRTEVEDGARLLDLAGRPG